MRVRVRLPAQHRPLVLIIPEGLTFTELKARACAKLRVAGCVALLLGSNAVCAQPEVEARNAPELEGVDEVSPEDTLIIVPLKTEACANSARVDTNEDPTATDDAGGEQDDNASDSSMNEDEEDEEDEDEDEGEEDAESSDVRCTGEQDRESVLRRRFARAQAEGRLIDLDVSDDDADESYVEGNDRSAGGGGEPTRKRRRRSPKVAAKPSLVKKSSLNLPFQALKSKLSNVQSWQRRLESLTHA